MLAARQFVSNLQQIGQLENILTVRCWLHGSLGATGKGHASDVAVMLGLCGHEPDKVEVDAIAGQLADIRSHCRITLMGQHTVAFNEKEDLLFMRASLPFHANGMRFLALDATGRELSNRVFYSVGGGFVVTDELTANGSRHKTIVPDATVLPLPFSSGDELLQVSRREGLNIAQVMRRNERMDVAENVEVPVPSLVGKA